MVVQTSWNFGEESHQIADLSKIRADYTDVHEFVVSDDGEIIAAPVEKESGQFGICVNGKLWEGEFEKAWHLKFSPNGQLTALVRIDDRWTVAVQGEPWEERFEFAWNTKFNSDGNAIGVQIKKSDFHLSLAINGTPWGNDFLSCRDYAISPDGKHMAACVQVQEVPEADIFKFMDGTWSIAVDGKPWQNKYINVYCPVFSPDGSHVAAEIRTDICDYSVAQDDTSWNSSFGCVWEPLYRNDQSIIVPIRQAGWTLAENGKPIWNNRYLQLWRTQLSPDKKHIAAVVAPGYGKWTVAVDDVPWSQTFGDMVLTPVFSPDSNKAAAAVKEDNRWTIAVQGVAWTDTFDMVWDPIFSPDGNLVIAKVEKDSKYTYAINGRIWNKNYQNLWNPIFSPDGKSILIRGVQDNKYYRQVVSISELTG